MHTEHGYTDSTEAIVLEATSSRSVAAEPILVFLGVYQLDHY